MDRRTLIKLFGLPAYASAFGVFNTAFSQPQESSPVNGRLAVIILEGGLDGLAAVPPIGDSKLFDHRSDLIAENAIKLNSDFSLSAGLSFFHGLMKKNQASAIHACAFPYIKRSHFEGQNVIQTGYLAPFSSKTGWIGRALELIEMPGRALSLNQPLILRGHEDVDTIYPAKIHGGKRIDTSVLNLLAEFSDDTVSAELKKVGTSVDEGLLELPRDPVSLAYQAGQAMAQPNGPVSSVINVSGFDTHAQQGADRGDQHMRLEELDSIFVAFKKGLGDKWGDSVILTITEFGRTVRMNGSWGTDHGYGSCAFLAGGRVKGGSVMTDWPGLAKARLFENRDLQPTIDLRSVFCGALKAAFAIPHEQAAAGIFGDRKIPDLAKYLFS